MNSQICGCAHPLGASSGAWPLWGKNFSLMINLTAHLLFSVLFIDIYILNQLKLHLSNGCNIASPQCKVPLNNTIKQNQGSISVLHWVKDYSRTPESQSELQRQLTWILTAIKFLADTSPKSFSGTNLKQNSEVAANMTPERNSCWCQICLFWPEHSSNTHAMEAGGVGMCPALQH